MGNNKSDEEQEKGFTVRDKRFSSKKNEKGESEIKGDEKGEEPLPEDTSHQGEPLPEINFINFIFSLSTSALIQLGEIQDPFSQTLAKNLP